MKQQKNLDWLHILENITMLSQTLQSNFRELMKMLICFKVSFSSSRCRKDMTELHMFQIITQTLQKNKEIKRQIKELEFSYNEL